MPEIVIILLLSNYLADRLLVFPSSIQLFDNFYYLLPIKQYFVFWMCIRKNTNTVVQNNTHSNPLIQKIKTNCVIDQHCKNKQK